MEEGLRHTEELFHSKSQARRLTHPISKVDPDSWVAEAKCCKTWYVLMPYPVRKCGECGERPVVDWHVVDDEH